ncbi:MAG: hypothetical protein JNJ91_04495 [Flavobacteriales bacterium]|nr:hypothetical protein [Flavobacteriales bacterium]
MKRVIPFLGLLASLSCGTPANVETSEGKAKHDTLYVSDNVLALGRLSQGLFDGSIEIFRNEELWLRQIWSNGQLITTDHFDNGLERRLVYVSERIDKDETSWHYTDSADTMFHIIPYDEEIIGLYKKFRRLSVQSFLAGRPTEFVLQNIPDELVKIGVSGARIKRLNEAYVMEPEGDRGDTLRVYFLYMVPSSSMDRLSFEVQ